MDDGRYITLAFGIAIGFCLRGCLSCIKDRRKDRSRAGKRFQLVTLCALAMLAGCVNLYTRWPTTDERIDRVYQCSREAAALSVLVSFPQAMSDGPSRGFMWENIFTVPLGCLCLCDAAVETCIDTVCLPVDWPLAESRKGGK